MNSSLNARTTNTSRPSVSATDQSSCGLYVGEFHGNNEGLGAKATDVIPLQDAADTTNPFRTLDYNATFTIPLQ